MQIAGINQETVNLIGATVKDFATSFLAKDSQTDHLTWISNELAARLPENSAGNATEIGQQIIDGVSDFDGRLESLRQACAQGGTTEDWLRGRLMGDAHGRDLQEYGDYLEKVHEGLAEGNATMARALESPTATIELPEEAAEEMPSSGTEWNKYTISAVAEGIDQQAHLASANGLSMPTDALTPDVPITPDMIPPEYYDAEPPSELDRGLKIAAAGALTVVSQKVHIPYISALFPVQGIVDLACWGVEGAKCIGRVAKGDISISEGLERMKRTTISVVANLIHHGFGAQIFKAIPVVGIPVSMAVTKVLGSISPQKIQEKLHEGITAVATVAKDVAKGIVATVKSVANEIKNMVASFFDW